MSLKRSLLVVFALLLALSFNFRRVAAQTMTTGGIAGVVTNPKNAVVPNATVTLRSSAKGTTQNTTTSDTGTYQFGLLDPGSYTVTVTMTGFQPGSKEVTVPLGQPVMVDFELSVKAKLPTERVGPSLIERENGNLDITLTHQQVQQAPNPGNDMTYLGQFAPGTIMNTQGGTGNFSNYGMPATSNRFSLDGMTDNEPFVNINNSGATRLLLGTNEIQEVNIVSNGYTGNHGEFAGATINYVTSSGGNKVHGNANYTWNSRILNANDFFNNASNTPRPFDTAHQWSASLGGPLKKDKLFFFFNTEGLRVLIPTSPLVVLPSPQFETATITNLQNIGRSDVANFYQNQIFGNLNNAPNANSALDNQFPGQFTDSSGQVHSTGDGCGAFSQNPLFFNNTSGPGPAQPCALGFRATASNFTHEMQFAGRVDYIASPKDSMFVRYQRDMGTQATYTDPINSVFNVQSSLPEDQGQLEWTHSFGPSTANQFLLAGQWYSAVFDTKNPTSGIFPTTLGLADGTFFNTAGPNPCANPPIGQGFPLLLGGRDCVNPQGRSTSQVQVSDDLSKTFGRQTIKIGGQFRRVNVSDHDFGTLQSGLLIVNTINDFYNGGATGDTLTQSFPQSLNQPIAYYTAGGYLEDDWRWSKTLNFTFALRVEHDSNPICRHLCFARLAAPFNFVAGINCVTNPDGSQTCSGNNQAQLLNVPYNQAINVNQLQALPGFQNLLWQPRFGFAWQPFGTQSKTVVRGGAGIFYNLFPVSMVDNFAQNPPNDATFVSTNDFIVPAGSAIGSSIFANSAATNTAFQTGFVTGETLGTIQANDPGFTPPNLFTSEAQTKVPRYYKWSLGIQHQLGEATSVSLNYVGNRGAHEPIIDNSANAFGFGNLPAQAADPRFTGVTILYAGGSSKYDGGTVTLIHRLNGAWGTGIVQASYTYSHASDEVSNGGFFPFSSTSLVNPQDPFNIHGNYG
ncbi:MAG: carboxypeptidase regulatory-like domain-containing protein, partial [Candidatus Acidiferrales bacterium]